MSTQLTKRGRGICSICQCPMQSTDAVITCQFCLAPFHESCWRHNDGCGNYRCEGAPQPMKLMMLEGKASGAWGDTKICPQCGDTLQSSALKCKRCKATFDTRAPMSPADFEEQQRRRAAARGAVFWAVVLFVASAFGVLAPVTLVLSIVWLVGKAGFLRRAAGAAELLLCGAFALSAAYLVLMLAIFGWGF